MMGKGNMRLVSQVFHHDVIWDWKVPLKLHGCFQCDLTCELAIRGVQIMQHSWLWSVLSALSLQEACAENEKASDSGAQTMDGVLLSETLSFSAHAF